LSFIVSLNSILQVGVLLCELCNIFFQLNLDSSCLLSDSIRFGISKSCDSLCELAIELGELSSNILSVSLGLVYLSLLFSFNLLSLRFLLRLSNLFQVFFVEFLESVSFVSNIHLGLESSLPPMVSLVKWIYRINWHVHVTILIWASCINDALLIFEALIIQRCDTTCNESWIIIQVVDSVHINSIFWCSHSSFFDCLQYALNI
jgi:hypothetical protein